jgi:hypothetical protein
MQRCGGRLIPALVRTAAVENSSPLAKRIIMRLWDFWKLLLTGFDYSNMQALYLGLDTEQLKQAICILSACLGGFRVAHRIQTY